MDEEMTDVCLTAERPKLENSDATVVFCPIVSRFETDVDSALSSISGKHLQILKSRNVILVAMHHTYDPNYALPTNRQMEARGVRLCVDCLFYEKTGLLSCAHNKKSVKKVYKEVILSSYTFYLHCDGNPCRLVSAQHVLMHTHFGLDLSLFLWMEVCVTAIGLPPY
uniref:Uncharacterized protein n=1 Tax=Mastacembelus armatus TaxID=205130 RepID=A0A3Q3M4J3_9TELE